MTCRSRTIKKADPILTLTTIVLVCIYFIRHNFSKLTFLSGRTGRFGRKGISINFVHDKKTWLQMEQIEKELGRKIMRIETNDLDEMEEVGFYILEYISLLTSSIRKWNRLSSRSGLLRLLWLAMGEEIFTYLASVTSNVPSKKSVTQVSSSMLSSWPY